VRKYGLEKASDILGNFIDNAKAEAFKVEVLQDYYAHDKGPSLDAWLAGDHVKSLEIIKQDGLGEWLIDYAKKPFKKTRLHIVESPHTPYIDWEIEFYKSVLVSFVGEDIGLVPKEKTTGLGVPDGDFWIIDDQKVVQFHYKDTQAYAGDAYDSVIGDDISRFLKLKTELLKLAQPIA